MSPKQGWMLAFAGAALYAAAQSINLTRVMPNVPRLELYLFELPVWVGVVAMSPAVFWAARRFPLFGPHALRNFFAHFIPATVVVFLQFVLIESMRRFLISPIVIGTGLASTKASLNYAMVAQNRPVLTSALIASSYYFVMFFFIYFALVLFHYSVNYYRELNTVRLRAQELQTMLAQSQLDALRLQLQPHFLFNTLNTVSGLMTRDVGLARQVLARLSDLLRKTLHDPERHEVTLASELEFLDSYLDIQTARFGHRLRVEKRIEEEVVNLLVPRMLLQPLVENSIRHGMRDGDDHPLCIRLEAVRTDRALLLRVVDDGVGPGDDELEEGVGLGNTRRRLEQLYDGRQQLQLSTPSTGGFEVTLLIPAQPAQPAGQLTDESTVNGIA